MNISTRNHWLRTSILWKPPFFRLAWRHAIKSRHLEFVGNKAKGRISKWVFQENKARQIVRKTNISYPLIRTRTFAYQGVRNVRLFGKFGVLYFLETSVLRFALLPYYLRIMGKVSTFRSHSYKLIHFFLKNFFQLEKSNILWML